MKLLLFNRKDYKSRYKVLINIWPLYLFGIIILYWKLNFLLASILVIILSISTFIEIKYLKRKIEEE